MNRLLLMSVLGFGLDIGAMQAAEVVVRAAPPRAIVEHRGVRPGPDHVWIGGYHGWDENANAWQAGHWEAPPRPHAVWVAPLYHIGVTGMFLWKAAGGRLATHGLNWDGQRFRFGSEPEALNPAFAATACYRLTCHPAFYGRLTTLHCPSVPLRTASLLRTYPIRF